MYFQIVSYKTIKNVYYKILLLSNVYITLKTNKDYGKPVNLDTTGVI